MRKLTFIHNKFKKLAFKCKTILQLDRIIKIYNFYVHSNKILPSKLTELCFDIEMNRISKHAIDWGTKL